MARALFRRLRRLRWTPPPTDFELLRAIYDRHGADYQLREFETGADNFIAIDIPAVAGDLKADPQSVFGRLYHHLDPKYAPPPQEGQPKKHLFTPALGKQVHCINFPFLEAVLADLWQQRRRDLWTYWTAAVSLGIAISSLVVSLTR